jgi:hypothetical protein
VAIEIIDNGSGPGVGGETVYSAFEKTKNNFDELYAITDALRDEISTFSTRADFVAANIPAPVVKTSHIDAATGQIVKYKRKSSGKYLATTADGAHWDADGVILLQHAGAVADWNGTTGTDNAAALANIADFVKENFSAAIFVIGSFFTSAPFVFTSFGVEVVGAAGETGKIIGGHISGPVIQFRKSYCICTNLVIGSNATRTAATYNIVNAGILVGDFNWANPPADFGSSGAFVDVKHNTVTYQPGPGIIGVVGGMSISRNNCQNNKGHGIQLDTGVAFGLVTGDIGFPGWTDISHNRSTNNGGHGTCIGSPTTGTQPPYRVRIYNNDCGGNATDAAVRYSLHQHYWVGEQIESGQNVAGGVGLTGGYYVAGRDHSHRLNRLTQPVNEAYEIGMLADYSSRGIVIDQFRVNTAPVSLNPAIKIAPTILSSYGIIVRQGWTASITKLVADADRSKFAMIHFADDADFYGSLKFGGSPVLVKTPWIDFTPTLEFVVMNDLVFTPNVNNVGAYKITDDGLRVQINLAGVPSWVTTAPTGIALIGGLPSIMDNTTAKRTLLPVTQTIRINYGTLHRLSAYANNSNKFRIIGTESGSTAATSLDATHFTRDLQNVIVFAGLVRTI